MITMRLQRIGRKNEPHFRVVVTDKRNGPKSGKFIEVIGSYNPKMGTVVFNTEKTQYYLNHGAQPSTTVHNFLVDHGIITGTKHNALPKKAPTGKRKQK